MYLSLAYMLLMGLFAGWLCKKCHLPALMGMLITGIVLGPYVLNLIDGSILNISTELRKIALIIILTRAGLTLNVEDLKKVGRPAILMCFVPACLEIIGMILLAPRILGVSIIDAFVMGTVVAAVSPAVIVPTMIKIIEEGYGTKQSIPQMVLAGASVDDVFVIVFFSVATSLAKGGSVDAMSFAKIPVSIFSGIVVGVALGIGLGIFFKKFHMRDTVKVIILMSVSLILVTLEDASPIPFSGLIAIMCMGIGLQRNRKEVSVRLSKKFNAMWVLAEIMLFILVGATVNISYALSAGVGAIICIFGALTFRVIGVYICMLGTKLNFKERLFCMVAYMPKATVQAAIGGVPLSMGLACGNIVLTVAVLAILITAPLGAFLIERMYKNVLQKA